MTNDERADTVRMLRQVCAAYGDNDWPDELHLADVIEKHLWRYLAEDEPVEPQPAVATVSIRDRIITKGQGWCLYTHQHDNSKAALAAALEALVIIDERLTATCTPQLNTGTAMDALILVGAALREIRAAVDVPPSPLSDSERLNGQERSAQETPTGS